MWVFVFILVIIAIIYNVIEWVIDCIKKRDWISLAIWIMASYILGKLFEII